MPHLDEFRTTLRKTLTPAEASFWNLVKNSKLDGRKFRRQHSVGNYILDFYCPSERLAVELDGEGHYSGKASLTDRERRQYIEEQGIKVIRFENKRVFEDREWVTETIRSHFGWRKRTTPSAEAAATPPS